MTSMEKLGEEIFAERKRAVLMVGKQFFCLHSKCIFLIVPDRTSMAIIIDYFSL